MKKIYQHYVEWLVNYLSKDSENRATFLAGYTCLLATPLLLVFGVIHFLRENHQTLLLVAILTISLMAILLIFQFSKNGAVLRWGAAAAFSVFSLYSMATGSSDGTGFIWMFCLPPFLTATVGNKCAIPILLILSVFNLIILFTPWLGDVYQHYDIEMKVRFCAAMLAVSLLSISMESTGVNALSKLEQANSQLKVMANTDPLTSLANRRAMDHQLKKQIALFHMANHPFTVILMDLDHFKKLNDEYGHDAGDEALILFSEILERHTRDDDIACRWGGEEFLFLLSNCTKHKALEVAERIRSSTERLVAHVITGDIRFTVSGGVADITEQPHLSKLIQLADDRLYQAKLSGRNQINSTAPYTGSRAK